MKKIIFRNLCILAIFSAILTIGLMTMVMYNETASLMQQQIKNEGGFLSLTLDREVPISFLKEASFVLPMSRITLINTDGSIIYDDRADAAAMENHLDRQEVQDAIRFGSGTSRRFSVTTGSETFYYAQKLANGQILRTSITVNIIRSVLMEMIPWFVIIALCVILLSFMLSSFQTKGIIGPINDLDLEEPLSNPAYDELAPLLIRMNNQNGQIKQQI
ncbi:MAG: PAS domain-containing sensor histidine kinase, partial [Clostridiales bacterium]|nr:PAS domain-containing sensor histidine kinase [Clostridiales bacterium]